MGIFLALLPHLLIFFTCILFIVIDLLCFFFLMRRCCSCSFIQEKMFNSLNAWCSKRQATRERNFFQPEIKLIIFLWSTVVLSNTLCTMYAVVYSHKNSFCGLTTISVIVTHRDTVSVDIHQAPDQGWIKLAGSSHQLIPSLWIMTILIWNYLYIWLWLHSWDWSIQPLTWCSSAQVESIVRIERGRQWETVLHTPPQASASPSYSPRWPSAVSGHHLCAVALPVNHTHCDVRNLRHTTSESSLQHLGLVYNPTIKVETANPQSRSPVNRKLINPCITGKSLQFCLILTALTYMTESAESL